MDPLGYEEKLRTEAKKLNLFITYDYKKLSLIEIRKKKKEFENFISKSKVITQRLEKLRDIEGIKKRIEEVEKLREVCILPAGERVFFNKCEGEKFLELRRKMVVLKDPINKRKKENEEDKSEVETPKSKSYIPIGKKVINPLDVDELSVEEQVPANPKFENISLTDKEIRVKERGEYDNNITKCGLKTLNWSLIPPVPKK